VENTRLRQELVDVGMERVLMACELEDIRNVVSGIAPLTSDREVQCNDVATSDGMVQTDRVAVATAAVQAEGRGLDDVALAVVRKRKRAAELGVTRVATELAAEHFDLGSLDTTVLRRGLLASQVRFLFDVAGTANMSKPHDPCILDMISTTPLSLAGKSCDVATCQKSGMHVLGNNFTQWS
jgi:hypothetical protein